MHVALFRLLLATSGLALSAGPALSQRVQLQAQPLDDAGAAEVKIVRAARPAVLSLRAGTVEMPDLTPAALNAVAAALPADRRCAIRVDGPLTPDRMKSLETVGLTIISPLFGDVWLGRQPNGPVQGAGTLGTLPFVKWAGPYNDAWKLDSQLGRLEFEPGWRADIKAAGNELATVYLFPDASPADVQLAAAAVLALNGEILNAEPQHPELLERGQVWEVVVPIADLAELATIPGIQYIEPIGQATLRQSGLAGSRDRRSLMQSGPNGPLPFDARGLNGQGQLIGVLDEWFNTTHCSLFDTAPIGPTHRKIQAILHERPAANRRVDHGTAVASIVAGRNAAAEDGSWGLAHQSRLVLGSFLAPLCPTCVAERLVTPAEWQTRVQDLQNQGAFVSNHSYGDDRVSGYTSWASVVDAWTYLNPDALVVFAGSNRDRLTSPDYAKNALTVVATGTAGRQNFKPRAGIPGVCGGNTTIVGGRGGGPDVRFKPDVMAPGGDTIVAARAGDNSPCWNTPAAGGCQNGDVTDGTSFAAPNVSAIAAMFRQYFQQGFYPAGRPTPGAGFTPSGALLRAMILNSAVDVTGSGGGGSQEVGFLVGAPNVTEGWGSVRGDNAAFFEGDARTLFVHQADNAQGLQQGQMWTRQIRVSNVAGNRGPLKVTLVWTDPPGTAGVVDPLRNDLDLVVRSSNGFFWTGNRFDVPGFSVASTPGLPVQGDRVNTVEMINVPFQIASPAETLTIEVRAHRVSNMSGVGQGFAVVATGPIDLAPASGTVLFSEDFTGPQAGWILSQSEPFAGQPSACSVGPFVFDGGTLATVGRQNMPNGSVNVPNEDCRGGLMARTPVFNVAGITEVDLSFDLGFHANETGPIPGTGFAIDMLFLRGRDQDGFPVLFNSPDVPSQNGFAAYRIARTSETVQQVLPNEFPQRALPYVSTTGELRPFTLRVPLTNNNLNGIRTVFFDFVTFANGQTQSFTTQTQDYLSTIRIDNIRVTVP